MARKKIYHGVSVGILMLDTSFERFPGDVGNGRTWPFPVTYRIVRGAVPDRVTSREGDETLLAPFKAAADELIAEGVDGITTTCGFLALYQQELAAHCSVPVATSALLQVPMVARILPKGRRPAVLTFSAESLSPRHLAGAGADPATPVFGMPASSEFQRSIRAGDTSVSRDTLRADVLEVARRAVASDPSIGALVLECTNMSPYSSDLSSSLQLPVFDIVSLVHWFHRSLRPEHFPPR
ncbi:MAG: aspartate/glutamate racemase family protein [Hyphomicrobiaceae bacterium]|nr:MAG: aspartate/glutamate racemase family protein [Hyphomicrobiaceae bacterium]